MPKISKDKSIKKSKKNTLTKAAFANSLRVLLGNDGSGAIATTATGEKKKKAELTAE
jgi:hypothetical protein